MAFTDIIRKAVQTNYKNPLQISLVEAICELIDDDTFDSRVFYGPKPSAHDPTPLLHIGCYGVHQESKSVLLWTRGCSTKLRAKVNLTLHRALLSVDVTGLPAHLQECDRERIGEELLKTIALPDSPPECNLLLGATTIVSLPNGRFTVVGWAPPDEFDARLGMISLIYRKSLRTDS